MYIHCCSSRFLQVLLSSSSSRNSRSRTVTVVRLALECGGLSLLHGLCVCLACNCLLCRHYHLLLRLSFTFRFPR